jgi:signal transduction histidine kinase
MAERLKLCDEAASLQSDLIRRVRDICDDLVPPDLRYQGLPDSLRRLCLDFKNKTGIDCRIEISENLNLKFLDEEKQLQIYQIAQESLTNIEKHARAKEAIIIMRSNEDGDLFVGISDDGKGFDASYENREQGGKPPSLGIRSMKKRAELLGGMLVIKSENGEGTLVCLEVPVKRDTNGSSVN